MMQNLLLLIIVFFAVFTQSLTGFGSGLVSMAFLPEMLGIATAAPLVALMMGGLELTLLIRFRAAFRLSATWRLGLASIAGIPIGIWVLRHVSEQVLLPILGVIMTGYALYALFNFKLPRLEHPGWAVLAGLLSGVLSGAYSVGGPPLIIYGNCRRWQPEEFRGNLQGLFLVNTTLVILGHALAGNITAPVLNKFVWAIPAVVLGLLIGARFDHRIDPQRFHRLVLILLAVMGIRLIWSSL